MREPPAADPTSYRAVVARERLADRLRRLRSQLASASHLTAAGLLVAALPLAFPVFSRQWRELPAAGTAWGSLSAELLASEGITAHERADERRGFLFVGPAAPQAWSISILVAGSSTSIPLPVTFVPDSVRQQPEYGRMTVESLALFLPFAAAARVLQRRRRTPIPLADRADEAGPARADA